MLLVGRLSQVATVLSAGGFAERAWHRNCEAPFVLRITLSSESSRTVLQVAGELVGEGVAELEKVVSSVAGEIVIDLSELRSADSSAVQTLLIIADRGVELRRDSAYIRFLLDREREAPVNRQPQHLEKK